MLVQARRRHIPLPYAWMSRAVDRNPVVSLTAYIASLLFIACAAAALALAWATASSSLAAEAGAASASGGVIRDSSGNGYGAFALFGMRAASAVGGAAAAMSTTTTTTDGKGVGDVVDGGVSIALLLAVVAVTLVCALAPAVVLAVGYRRRTRAFWLR